MLVDGYTALIMAFIRISKTLPHYFDNRIVGPGYFISVRTNESSLSVLWYVLITKAVINFGLRNYANSENENKR